MLMLAVSVPCIFRGIRASVASGLYYQAKYGSARDNLRGILSRCEMAYNFYPYNYYFCIWSAEQSYYTAMGLKGRERESLLNSAGWWCDIGLRLNRHKSQLRLLKTRLMTERSLPDAVKFWENYVDWHFWEPYNHAVLVELYCMSGDMEKAMDAIRFVKDSKYYDEASMRLSEAWKKDVKIPQIPLKSGIR
jgi:hypothetical protein